MNYIYTIYTFRDVVDTENGKEPFIVQPIGFYFEELDAIDCVVNNFENISNYNSLYGEPFEYCCIEKISQGIYSESYVEKRWFKWDFDKCNYIEIFDLDISENYIFEVG